MNQALQDVIEHRRTTNVFEPNHTISDASYRTLAAPTHPATSSGDMKSASAEGARRPSKAE